MVCALCVCALAEAANYDSACVPQLTLFLSTCTHSIDKQQQQQRRQVEDNTRLAAGQSIASAASATSAAAALANPPRANFDTTNAAGRSDESDAQTTLLEAEFNEFVQTHLREYLEPNDICKMWTRLHEYDAGRCDLSELLTSLIQNHLIKLADARLKYKLLAYVKLLHVDPKLSSQQTLAQTSMLSTKRQLDVRLYEAMLRRYLLASHSLVRQQLSDERRRLRRQRRAAELRAVSHVMSQPLPPPPPLDTLRNLSAELRASESSNDDNEFGASSGCLTMPMPPPPSSSLLAHVELNGGAAPRSDQDEYCCDCAAAHALRLDGLKLSQSVEQLMMRPHDKCLLHNSKRHDEQVQQSKFAYDADLHRKLTADAAAAVVVDHSQSEALNWSPSQYERKHHQLQENLHSGVAYFNARPNQHTSLSPTSIDEWRQSPGCQRQPPVTSWQEFECTDERAWANRAPDDANHFTSDCLLLPPPPLPPLPPRSVSASAASSSVASSSAASSLRSAYSMSRADMIPTRAAAAARGQSCSPTGGWHRQHGDAVGWPQPMSAHTHLTVGGAQLRQQFDANAHSLSDHRGPSAWRQPTLSGGLTGAPANRHQQQQQQLPPGAQLASGQATTMPHPDHYYRLMCPLNQQQQQQQHYRTEQQAFASCFEPAQVWPTPPPPQQQPWLDNDCGYDVRNWTVGSSLPASPIARHDRLMHARVASGGFQQQQQHALDFERLARPPLPPPPQAHECAQLYQEQPPESHRSHHRGRHKTRAQYPQAQAQQQQQQLNRRHHKGQLQPHEDDDDDAQLISSGSPPVCSAGHHSRRRRLGCVNHHSSQYDCPDCVHLTSTGRATADPAAIVPLAAQARLPPAIAAQVSA